MAHKPLSICASVPQKTRNIDRTKRTTVRRSEASGLRACLRSFQRSTRRSRTGGGVTGGAGVVVICVDTLFMGSSLAIREANRLDERFKGGLLFTDQFGVSLHFNEPGSSAVDDPGAENALRPGWIAAGQIDVRRFGTGNIQFAQLLLKLSIVADWLQPELLPPAIDIRPCSAAAFGQRHYGHLGDVFTPADHEDRQPLNALRHVGRPLFPIVRLGKSERPASGHGRSAALAGPADEIDTR